jgi:transposase
MIDNPLNRLSVKRGSALPHAKLTETDVEQIRELVAHRDGLIREARTLRNADIAEKFGVHLRTIDKITAGYAWTHVP